MTAIVMSCYGQLGYTRWCMESIQRNSNGHSLAYYLVDNGSTDETYQYFATYRPNFLRRYSVNGSLSRAWNQGLRAALEDGHETICLMSNDVVVGPGWLDSTVRELAKPEKRYFIPNGNFKHETLDVDVRNALPSLQGKMQPALAAWCVTFTAEAVRTFFPIPEELTLWFGDNWIHEKLAKAGYSCWELADSCAVHFLSKTVFTTPEVHARIERDKLAWERLRQTI